MRVGGELRMVTAFLSRHFSYCFIRRTPCSHPVPNQTLDEKVTFRFLNFDNLLAYQPLIYGKPVWVVVISGLGDTGAKGWMTGSFLGAKVQKNVALPISEQVREK